MTITNKFNIGDLVDVMGGHCKGFRITNIYISKDEVRYDAGVEPDRADGDYILITLTDLKETWLTKADPDSFVVDNRTEVYVVQLIGRILQQSYKCWFLWGKTPLIDLILKEHDGFKSHVKAR